MKFIIFIKYNKLISQIMRSSYRPRYISKRKHPSSPVSPDPPENIKRIKCEKEIKTLSELIAIIPHSLPPKIEYINLNIYTLFKIKDELIELNSLIGLEELKDSILNQLL